MNIGSFQHGSGERVLSSALQQIAEDVIRLNASARFEVTQHRRGHIRGGEEDSAIGDCLFGRPKALGGGDGRALLVKLDGERRTSNCRDVRNRRAHEACHAGERRQRGPLVPHILQNGWAQPRSEVGATQRSAHCLDARAIGVEAIAKVDRFKLVEVMNHAIGPALRRDVAGAAQHLLCAETLVEPHHVGHAVEQRQDGRFGADGGRNRLDRRVEIVGLRGQHNQVVVRVDVARKDGWRMRDEHISVRRADHAQTVFRQHLRGVGTHQERDIAPRRDQSRAEVAAHCTGAKDEDSHPSILAVRSCRVAE